MREEENGCLKEEFSCHTKRTAKKEFAGARRGEMSL